MKAAVALKDDQRLQIVFPRAVELARLPPSVRRLAQLCDGTRTFAGVCKTSGLPAAQTREVVERLLSLGVVVPSDREKRRRRRLSAEALAWSRTRTRHFSADEEAFFASSIEHLVDDV